MRAEYNPFKTEEYIETDYGVINNRMRRYFSNRNEKHFFKKFQGFGISLTEIDLCKKHHVKKINIKYHGTKKNYIYQFDMEHLDYFPTYEYEGDEQVILQIKDGKLIGEEIR